MITLTRDPQLIGDRTENYADDHRPASLLPLGMVARFTAPERFDVHQIKNFESWAAEAARAEASMLVIDCSMVRFIDLAAVDAIAAARSVHHIEVADPSVAVSITYRLLDASPPTTIAHEAA